jgi:fluoride exporter
LFRGDETLIWFFIAAGGAAGAVARYGLGRWVHAQTGFAFPWGTFVVNVTGSLLIGFALRYFQYTQLTPELRALVTVGLLGGFTTFSTFSYETVVLIEQGAWARATLYSAGGLLAGVGAVYAGIAVGGHVLPGRLG